MPSEDPPNGCAKARELARDTPTQKKTMAVVIQAEPGRQAQDPVRWHVPCNRWRQVMRGIVQAETMAIAQTPVHLDSSNKILPANTASLRRSLQGQRAACANRIAKLPRIASDDALGGEGVFGNVPSLESLGQQQLEFQLVLVFLPSYPVRT